MPKPNKTFDRDAHDFLDNTLDTSFEVMKRACELSLEHLHYAVRMTTDRVERERGELVADRINKAITALDHVIDVLNDQQES